MLLFKFLFWISLFFIFFAFIGYPFSLFILNKLIKNKKNIRDTSLRPSVSIIIPAHNEEAVIEKKLNNLVRLNYPKELVEIIIASDNSTDRTNEIVSNFINCNKEVAITLFKVNQRQGKTNAQNEAVKIAKGEILLFSDANAIISGDAIIHLVSSFTEDNIIYVTGQLKYTNDSEHLSSEAESNYWNYDLIMRKMESDIQTITAGNGALYAIRENEYVDLNPIGSHDSDMPLHAGTNRKRAVYNEMAIAFEKAGETSKDEFKRKIRMSRGILDTLFKNFGKYNVFKHGWFSYFYFGHRTLRYSLFLLHIIVFISNILIIRTSTFYCITMTCQVVFYLFALIGKSKIIKGKIFYYTYYYCMTITAQLIGAINQITGKSKPFWEKAESTR